MNIVKKNLQLSQPRPLSSKPMLGETINRSEYTQVTASIIRLFCHSKAMQFATKITEDDLFIKIKGNIKCFNLDTVKIINQLPIDKIYQIQSLSQHDNKILTADLPEDWCSHHTETQVSFENTFFDEHMEVLNLKVQRFAGIFNLQYCLNQESELNRTKINQHHFINDRLKSKREIDQFIKGLESDGKVKEFVTLLSQKFTSNVSNALEMVVFYTWLEYGEIRKFCKFEKDGDDILKIAKVFSSGKLRNLIVDSIPMFGVSNVNQTQLQQINEFLTFFITTVLFITEEFFQNPFYVKKELRKDEELSQCSEQPWFQSQCDYKDDDNSDQEGDGQSNHYLRIGKMGRKLRKLE